MSGWIRQLGIFAITMIMAAPAYAACVNPTGVAGDVVYNQSYDTVQYCDNTNWIGVGGEQYSPNAVDFDNSRLEYSTELTGVSTGTKATISFWVRFDSASSFQYQIWDNRTTAPDTTIEISVLGGTSSNDNDLRFTFGDGLGNTILNARTGYDFDDDGWHHVLFSFDLTDVNKRHIYIDGIPDATNWNIYNTSGLIDFVSTEGLIIGSRDNGLRKFKGDIADMWVNFGTYIDLSVEANRRKFIDENGFPIYLGANGELPTGTSPDVYLTGDTDDWHTNKGTGGGFVEDGALTTALSSPVENVGPMNGLVGWWKLDETSGTTAVDSSGSGNDLTLEGGLALPADSGMGIINKAFNFDGIDDFLDGIACCALGTNNSVGYWVQLAQYPPEEFSGFGKSGENTRGYGIDANGDLFFSVTGISKVSISPPENIDFTKWNHVFFSRTDTNVDFYLNGILLGSDTLSDNSDTRIDRFGNRSSSSGEYYIHGRADDVRIYSRPLNASEIQQLYNYGRSCQNPSGFRGNVVYNHSSDVMQYCTGNGWKAMAKPLSEGPVGGLVGHWKLDETGGTVITDSTNNISMTMQNGMTGANSSVSGAINRGLSFDGVDDYIFTSSGTDPLFDLFSGGGSISFWINSRDNSDPALIDAPGFLIRQREGSGGETGFWFTHSFTGTDGVWRADSTNPQILLNQWNHIVLEYNSDDLSNIPLLYINGQKADDLSIISAPVGTASNTGDSRTTIGASITGNVPFEGSMDDLRFYNRALTTGEIALLYNGSNPDPCSPSRSPDYGTTCADGSTYAGLSPDGNEPMYLMAGHKYIGLSWNSGTSNNTDIPEVDYDVTPASLDTGEANTNLLVTRDSDSVAAGIQKHEQADYCYNLSPPDADALGRSDWYLPAFNEMTVVYENLVDEDGDNDPDTPTPGVEYGLGTGEYFTSNQRTINTVYPISFATGAPGSTVKNRDNRVFICARKGYKPASSDCTNPTGRTGDMVYNTSENVLQYCEGNLWIGVGK